ncbi:MAG: TrmH family RNA methyltransferase [bacterium]|nr:TrmH family RNA methyltransferase [bacterium]
MRPPLYLIAQNIRSLFNVGALFRCADVFGVDKIFLCGYTGYPPRKEISKTALGAENWIPWERHYQTHRLLLKLKSEGVRIVALETDTYAHNLPSYTPTFPMALVVGSEVNGISDKVREYADDIVHIPMVGKKESLNVGVATGVALYELSKKHIDNRYIYT